MHTLGLRQSGGNVFFELAVLPVGYASGGYYSGTVTGQTVQAATAVTVAPDQGVDDTIMGHFWVQSQLTNLFSEIGQLNANVSETADVRLKRLCRENSVPLTVVGTSKILMGEQRVDTLINLLRECELADQGVLYDGVDAGLTYICGSHRLNQAPVITIDATRGDLAKELAPVDDDQRNVNRCKADRTWPATPVRASPWARTPTWARPLSSAARRSPSRSWPLACPPASTSSACPPSGPASSPTARCPRCWRATA
jgi:hypothetical protein